jgi:hypothetical protein
VVSAYFDGKLTEGEVREFEVHLASCDGCQAEIAAIVRLPPEPTAETGRAEPVVALPVVTTRTEPSRVPAQPTVEAMGSRAEDVDGLEPVEDFRRWRQRRDSRRRRRRTLWTWLAPMALAASAVLAISVTYRFSPLKDLALRRSLESESNDRAAQSARPLTASREANTGAEDHLQAPRADVTAPTTAASPAAPSTPEMQRAEPGSAPPEAEPREETEEVFPAPAEGAPQASAAPSAPAPPVASRPGGEAIETTEAMQSKAEQQPEPQLADRAALRSAQPANQELGAALAKAAEPDRDRGVVIVARTDHDVAWRVGDASIERSDDGGKTWRAQPAGGATGLLAGSAPSTKICWLAGRSGLVLRTTDGERWEQLAAPTTSDLTRISAWSATKATVRAVGGERFSTRNGGKSWSKR